MGVGCSAAHSLLIAHVKSRSPQKKFVMFVLIIKGPDGLADFLPISIVASESLWRKMVHYWRASDAINS